MADYMRAGHRIEGDDYRRRASELADALRAQEGCARVFSEPSRRCVTVFAVFAWPSDVDTAAMPDGCVPCDSAGSMRCCGRCSRCSR